MLEFLRAVSQGEANVIEGVGLPMKAPILQLELPALYALEPYQR